MLEIFFIFLNFCKNGRAIDFGSRESSASRVRHRGRFLEVDRVEMRGSVVHYRAPRCICDACVSGATRVSCRCEGCRQTDAATEANVPVVLLPRVAVVRPQPGGPSPSEVVHPGPALGGE